jgi:hypothetical protein
VKRLHVGLGARTSLYNFINRLRKLGLPGNDADALHALRDAANAGKHNPRKTYSVGDALSILTGARSAVSNVGVIGAAPGANDQVIANHRRRFAISISDYPTHGEVDYQVDILLNDGGVLHVDAYQANFKSEPTIKTALIAHGTLDEKPSDQGVNAYLQLMAASSELTTVWLFEGSLGDLARAFAPHQHAEALLFLRRRSDSQAVRVAACLAAIDLGLSRAGSTEALIETMTDEYALSVESIEQVASEVSTLARCALGRGAPDLHGPRVLSPSAFRRVTSAAPCFSDAIQVAIDTDGTLMVRQKQPFEPMP